MERELADILREERNLGHKGDVGWKTVAFNTTANILAAQFNLQISADNIRNRVKSWKKFYGVVKYVKSHDNARGFRFKVIENWDDIVDLCGKDRATGGGAETGAYATEVMTPTNEVDHVDLDGDTQDLEDIHVIDDISPTSTNSQKRRNRASNSSDILPTKKRGAVKDGIADSIARMALSFEEFICANTKNLDPAEVYAEVKAIPGLSENEQLKACAWLIENDKQFQMLKALPIKKKRKEKSMLLMFIARGE
ncbi:hypothetical protein L3X38_001558 [Prunus dulcis]|uniref:Myb/SANT-like domain-containing protein n=1 Tax=Prunus dulcis TaxID=3755 RepID=A0AAD4WSV8_PRUDU|nr:hypothetical protein L3X38_001558 [Prunus dulcis]